MSRIVLFNLQLNTLYALLSKTLEPGFMDMAVFRKPMAYTLSKQIDQGQKTLPLFLIATLFL